MSEQNSFGLMSKEYNSARRGYPQEVFEYLKTIIKIDKPLTLDIGCGTGISTRQLKQSNFTVTGVDKDAAMIDVALNQTKDIDYLLATADILPFESNTFDLVTAFTAFHWFNDKQSLLEIKRVMKKGGIFFAALKTNRDDENVDFRNGYTTILKKYAGEHFDRTQDHFNKEHLIKVGFSSITEKSFAVDENYTVEEALTLQKSLSIWNLIKEDERSDMLKEMQEFYENHLVNGYVLRSRKISTFFVYNR